MISDKHNTFLYPIDLLSGKRLAFQHFCIDAQGHTWAAVGNKYKYQMAGMQQHSFCYYF
jgi:hypothetical protein